MSENEHTFQSAAKVSKHADNIPSFCLLVVNKQCNFHCRMCHMWKHKPDPRTLSLDEMKECVRELRTFIDEPIFIHLIGGETLLWPHTPELARFIVDTGFRTSITTNGYLIDTHMAERIVKSGMSGVFISLDSLNAERHDYIRGMKGSFEQVVRAVDYLYKNRGSKRDSLSIGLTFTIMQYNIDEVCAFAEWAEANEKVDAVFFNAVMQPFDSGEDSREWFRKEIHHEIWPQDLGKVDAVLDRLMCHAQKGSKMCNPPEQLKVLKEYFKNPYRFRQHMGIKCTRGDRALEINAYGDIAMCFYMPPLGNIRSDSIRDIWFSEKMKHVRRAINQCTLECDLAVNCFYKLENITDYIT